MKKLDVQIHCSSGPDTAHLRIEDPVSGITIMYLKFNAEEWGKLCLCTTGLRKTVEVGALELIGMTDNHETRVVWIQGAPKEVGHKPTPQRKGWFKEQVQRWAKPGERGRGSNADNPHCYDRGPGPGPDGENGSWRKVTYYWYEDENGEVYVPPEERLSLLLE